MAVDAASGNVSVRERARPGYEPAGIPVGEFTLRPVFEFGGGYVSNVFATPSGASDDVTLNAGAFGVLESNWGVHSLDAFWDVDYWRYLDHTDESNLEGQVGVRGRLDAGVRTSFSADGSFARVTEPRTATTSPIGISEPGQHDLLSTTFSARHQFDQLTLSGAIGYKSYEYDASPLLVGGSIDQSFRNRDEVTASARGNYDVSPSTSVFAEISVNDRSYDLRPPAVAFDKSSNGYDVLVGASVDMSRFARGEVAIGYFQQDFDDAPVASADSIDGFDVSMNVTWFPSELTNVTFRAARDVGESALVGSSGFVSTSMAVAVDHDLYWNVLLFGEVGYASDDYEGIDRVDDRFSISAGATYLIDEKYAVDVVVSRLSQESDGAQAFRNFDVNKLGVKLRMSF